ncbi:hypothetical protein MZM66_002478 [Enterococcus faecium]|nr:hypothetical protein [Enterococcus faecium]
MKIDSSTISQLLSSLDEYNPVANQFVEKVSSAIVPVAMMILGTLMYLELADTKRRTQVEQGRLNSDIFISVAWSYLVGFVLIVYSDEILDSFIWVINATGHLINKVSTNNSDLEFVVPEIKGKVNMAQKLILNGMSALAMFFAWAAELVVKVLVFLRAFDLFIFKAAAPVLVAGYASEEWRPVSMNFLKRFLGAGIQGFLLIIILKLYPALITNDMFDLVADGSWQENLSAMFLSIAKSVVFLIVLVGSQRKAKEWMG